MAARAALLRQLRVRLGRASGPMKPEGVSTRTLSNRATLDAEMERRDDAFMWVCSLSCSLCALGIALDEEINHIRNIKANWPKQLMLLKQLLTPDLR